MKKTTAEEMIGLFTDKTERQNKKEEGLFIKELYREVGQLKAELDRLKKKFGFISKGQSFAYRTEKYGIRIRIFIYSRAKCLQCNHGISS